jgi:putative transposase
MRAAVSPSTGWRYPLTMVCQVWRVARSSVYATGPVTAKAPTGRRGPKPVVTDAILVEAIRVVLAATPFHGEGYRKVRARLAHRGLAVSGKRVLRLMRQHQLLAPRRLGPPDGDPAHTGTITMTAPNLMTGWPSRAGGRTLREGRNAAPRGASACRAGARAEPHDVARLLNSLGGLQKYLARFD